MCVSDDNPNIKNTHKIFIKIFIKYISYVTIIYKQKSVSTRLKIFHKVKNWNFPCKE